MGLFDVFKSNQPDRKIFFKKIKAAEKVWEIMQAPISGQGANGKYYSGKQIQEAIDITKDARDWWLNNRERLHDQDWMNADVWFETNKAFGLEMIAY